MDRWLLGVHIVLVIAWLGIDVGVFTSSFVMRRPGLSAETRTTIRRLMRALDLAPRISLLLMIPVALTLARLSGWGLSNVPAWVFWLIAVVFVAMAVASVGQFMTAEWIPTWFGRADWWLRVLASAGFLVLGLASLTGSDWLSANWLAWKALLFGVLIALGLRIRTEVGTYAPHMDRLIQDGETPEVLADVATAIRRVYVLVVGVWSGLVIMIFIAVLRP